MKGQAHAHRYDTIRVERVLNAAPARIFALVTSAATRSALEPLPEGMTRERNTANLSVGPLERSTMTQHGQTMCYFEERCIHLETDARYVMSTLVKAPDGTPLQSSQTTMEFLPEGPATRVICTEQVAWCSGEPMRADHEGGWTLYLDNIEAALSQ